MADKPDIDILAYALRKAILDQSARAKARQAEGATDAANGCHARLVRLRRELNRLDEMGAVEAP